MLAQIAKQVFRKTLLSLGAKEAVRRIVKIVGKELLIGGDSFQLNKNFSIYVVAVGKAAYPMAIGFDEIAGDFIKGGMVSGVIPENQLPDKWQVFAGGHPLPNEESFASAKAAFELLKKADKENALVVFLISGGGSAMMDLPGSEEIGLENLRDFNRILVNSGATIAEINSIRRAISQVKGGGLALAAPNAKQISLIISDTADGDVSSVASRPSLLPAKDIPGVDSVLEKYDLKGKFSASINRLLENYRPKSTTEKLENNAHILLDNQYALRQAAEIAEKLVSTKYVILSGGSDGIDGNSPATGAVADETTLKRAELQKLNPLEYLANSHSFAFFDNLNDAIIVGATGTNVRDIRILLAK